MRNAGLRRSARLLAIVATIALVFSSLNVTAIMQSSVDPATRKLPTQKPATTQRIPLQLVPLPNLPTACTNVLLDSGFETGGIPNTFWNPETSTNFGTPLCDVPSCGSGGGASPPLEGAFWAWFGGIPAPETATLGQTVTIAASSSASLHFWMRIGTVSSPFTDVLNVRVDGVIQQSFPEPTVAESAYTPRTINMTPFANGLSHTILFEYIGPTSGTGSYVIDDVSVGVCTPPTAAPANITGRITTPDGASLGGATVHLNGAATRTTVTDGAGNYHFDNLDTGNFYSLSPSLANYAFAPASRSFSLVGNRTEAGFTANPDASQSANAIDTVEYFVRQQYLDFLNREPDQGGLEYWNSQFDVCNADVACIRNKRLDVSAAFFASLEFQQTGSYVYGLYAGTLGRIPGYGEFMPDRAQVVGGSGLEAAKAAFAEAFVQRAEFSNRYSQSLTREQFVDAMLQTMTQRSGVNHSSLRDGLLNDYDMGGRALVARHASEASAFVAAEYNKGFVLMEYFGYLRRDIDQGGYNFWLNVLNEGDQGNYRGMVCSFITSTEYQRRFSSLVTHGNADCGQ
jgi:hypothetical protein